MVRKFETAAGELGAGSIRAVSIRRTGPPDSLVYEEIPLENASEAHRLLEGRTSIGKIVLSVRD
jgi:hypothetical protein